MPVKIRESKGSGFASRGHFYARVTTAPQKREAKILPWCTSIDAAHARARALQELVNRLRGAGEDSWVDKVLEIGAAADDEKLAKLGTYVEAIVQGKIVHAPAPATSTVVTYEAFARKWVRGELTTSYPDYVERKRSAYVDLGFLRKYVFPVVGSKPIGEVTLEDFEQVMREIDTRAGRKLARATRRQIAQVMRRVLVLAEYPAKLISRNPIPTNAMPPKRSDVGLQFAYPEEDAILMKDARADLGWRFLFGFLHRQGVRRSEALGGKVDEVDEAIADDDALGDVPALTWNRIDFRRGAILADRNKTNDTTLTPLEADLVRALQAWKKLSRKAAPTDPVFVLADGSAIDPRAATDAYRATLQAALVAANADRPELWNPPRGRRELRLHDARASFVTVALANGRSEDWVRRRSKHKSSAIERYRRELGTFREMNLGDWAPLDIAIPELAAANAVAEHGSRNGPPPDSSVGASGFEPPTPRPPEGALRGRTRTVATLAITNESLGDVARPPLPRSTAASPTGSELLAALRQKLDAAILAEAWEAVKAIHCRIRELEREGVVDLEGERARRRK